MHFSLENRVISLSVGEFANFSLGPQESGGGPQGLWRAQLGQHWHNELQKRTELEFTEGGALRPDVKFEVVIDGRITHRGWTFALTGRIDQLLPLDCRAGSPNPASSGGVSDPALPKSPGMLLREIKSLDKSQPIVAQCLGGGRSAIAASILLRAGFDVTDMHGGFLAWGKAGFPVEAAESVA